MALTGSPITPSLAAGATTDPRFGVVNAFEAPDSAFESGASWELLTLRWDALQPASASDWTPSQATDDWIKQARANSREVVAVLTTTPAWATDGTVGVGVPRGLNNPATSANNVWGGFVREAVSYYSARGVNRYVIWDTPSIQANSIGATWEGTTEDYYQLVKVAYQVAKGANPGAIIHLGGVSDDNPAWFQHFLNAAIADSTAAANNTYFDVATVHVFNSPDRVYTLTANPSAVMSSSGVALKPVWVNETNARPAVDPVYPPDTTFRVASRVTQEQQAAFIVQSYALAFAAGADRVAVYRMADNLDEDGQQAFGLVRKDGDPRPALAAYQIVTREFSGFQLARRVDEQSQPLIDYVRLTFPTKVTHVAWALTQANATLVIPARSEQATLIDLQGNRSLVKPQGGVYRLVVGGADCNDPNTVGGCLIGGAPWILVEEGVSNPLNEVAPKVTVDIGGVVPTPDLGSILTATALAQPTATPTNTEIPLTETPIAPTETAASEVTTAPDVTPEQPTEAMVEATELPTQAVAEAPTLAPTLTPEEALRPEGLSAILPYALMVLGALAIGGGVWFFLRSGSKPSSAEKPTMETIAEIEPPLSADDTSVATKTVVKRGRRKPSGKDSADES